MHAFEIQQNRETKAKQKGMVPGDVEVKAISSRCMIYIFNFHMHLGINYRLQCAGFQNYRCSPAAFAANDRVSG